MPTPFLSTFGGGTAKVVAARPVKRRNASAASLRFIPLRGSARGLIPEISVRAHFQAASVGRPRRRRIVGADGSRSHGRFCGYSGSRCEAECVINAFHRGRTGTARPAMSSFFAKAAWQKADSFRVQREPSPCLAHDNQY